jgi:hypothetical protein
VQWQQSVIVPVYMKGSKACIKNCRSVLLLDSFSKVFAFLIHEHLSYYFKRKLNSSQHGFFSQSKSTITNMVSYLHFISPLVCSQRQVDVLFLDLSIAYSLSDAYVIWLDSYLTGHYFVV